MDGQISEEDLKNMSPEQILELQKQNCIFCKIIKGEIPSKKVYEDKHSLCILDINPAAKGHVLILPKEHYQIMPQIPQEVLGSLFLTAKKISQVLLKGMLVSGTNIFVANGGIAGQRAPHFMIHVIPREENDHLFEMTINRLTEKEISNLKEGLAPSINSLFGRNISGNQRKLSPENLQNEIVSKQITKKSDENKIVEADYSEEIEKSKKPLQDKIKGELNVQKSITEKDVKKLNRVDEKKKNDDAEEMEDEETDEENDDGESDEEYNKNDTKVDDEDNDEEEADSKDDKKDDEDDSDDEENTKDEDDAGTDEEDDGTDEEDDGTDEDDDNEDEKKQEPRNQGVKRQTKPDLDAIARLILGG